ncbi:MAG: asparagine--tRNA ligase [Proteobacteria bacterium]|jgi:asparaginyl-tRNA synthetase|nr:asparagine--tRNA ligase [Pseudomonadota bacterium]
MSAGIGRRQTVRTLLSTAAADKEAVLTGWVKTSRFSKNVSFIHIFDGSTPKTIQVVLGPEIDSPEMRRNLGVGTAVRATGRWVPSPGGKQDFEILASAIDIVGPSDPSTYPLQRKGTSFEFLRTIAHVRPRSNTHQAVFRVRNALSWQIHKYFQEHGFLWIHTPIITASDCEGAGELFQVSADIKDPTSFFGAETFLTVSGQLEVECFAQSHGDVYTFGPTFRAENSNTARHAAEFWMIEPEMAFANLDDVIALAEDFIRTVGNATIDQCADDFDFFNLRIAKGIVDANRAILAKKFSRLTYAEAQEILVKAKRKFEFPVGQGASLQAEHERFLAEKYFKGPVFVTDYPIEQKSFYMRVNDDQKTVAATDLLVPRLGEIIGGSQREERLEVLEDQMNKRGTNKAPLWWYLDLRRWGTAPHGGFGLGFERMLMWLTGMQNIRDVIAFPRTPGNADF